MRLRAPGRRLCSAQRVFGIDPRCGLFGSLPKCGTVMDIESRGGSNGQGPGRLGGYVVALGEPEPSLFPGVDTMPGPPAHEGKGCSTREINDHPKVSA